MSAKTNEKRRKFLQALPALLLGCVACQGCEPAERKKAPPPKIPLGPAQQFDSPLTVLGIKRIAVLKDEGGLAAISLVCTHQACLLSVNTQGGPGFSCSCHGAQFDKLGKVTQGPAKTDLPWWELSVDTRGQLIADTGKRVDPGWRLKTANLL